MKYVRKVGAAIAAIMSINSGFVFADIEAVDRADGSDSVEVLTGELTTTSQYVIYDNLIENIDEGRLYITLEDGEVLQTSVPREGDTLIFPLIDNLPVTLSDGHEIVIQLTGPEQIGEFTGIPYRQVTFSSLGQPFSVTRNNVTELQVDMHPVLPTVVSKIDTNITGVNNEIITEGNKTILVSPDINGQFLAQYDFGDQPKRLVADGNSIIEFGFKEAFGLFREETLDSTLSQGNVSISVNFGRGNKVNSDDPDLSQAGIEMTNLPDFSNGDYLYSFPLTRLEEGRYSVVLIVGDSEGEYKEEIVPVMISIDDNPSISYETGRDSQVVFSEGNKLMYLELDLNTVTEPSDTESTEYRLLVVKSAGL